MIQHRRDPRGGGIAHPLGHRQHHHAAIGRRQHALPAQRSPMRERRAKIEPTEQGGIVDMRRNAPQRRALWQRLVQRRHHRIAQVAPAAQNHPPQANRIIGT